MKQWFEVSREGLKQLQLGKPKHFIARELIQNAWDESIFRCSFHAEFKNGLATIVVEDDDPEGFQDITDAFTLFQPTSKRGDPTKRGRFNIGEKQVLALCERAEIFTTKGTVTFDNRGRKMGWSKKINGSRITVQVKMEQEEFDDMLRMVKRYKVPKHVCFVVNGQLISYLQPYKELEASLITEKEVNGAFVRMQRKTKMYLHKPEGRKAILYEMGLPVMEMDCQFDVDVQQKVPLSIDRDTVPTFYLKAVFAEVLNITYQDVEKEEASELWVRQAMADKRIKSEAVKEIVEKRFGDKVAIANPFDPVSIDDAVSHGYNVVHGSEMSKEEWENIRKAEAIKSTTELFGSDFTDATVCEPDVNMERVKRLAQKMAKQVIGVDLTVVFVKSPQASVRAQYGNDTLTFNVSKLGVGFFNPPLSAQVIDLIVHELGHHAGHHTEASYHDLITKMAGELVMLALEDSTFFKV